MTNARWLAATWCFAGALAAEPEPVSFARTVKPLLAKKCFACHGPQKAEAGVRLDSAAGLAKAGESKRVPVVAGAPGKSEVLRRTSSHDDSERMPPEGKPLSAPELAALKQWIAEGAKWEDHWAFVPPRPQTPPIPRNAAWVRNPIDAFVLAKLEKAGLAPAPPADPRTLLRRAYFDLVGLPPTPAEAAAFRAAAAQDFDGAYAALVDRLLADPRHGERWARHWLDVVRFAESNSFERDGDKPNAWRYRDYVIRSLNQDKPYARFVQEQLAGDELPDGGADGLVATGFLRLGVWDDEPADPDQAKFDGFDDLVTTTSQAFLGLTVNCARCHDHKIDPIPQGDYYSMLAFFRNLAPNGREGPNVQRPLPLDAAGEAERRQQREDRRRALDAAQKKALALESEFRSALAAGHLPDLDDLEFRYYRDTWDKLPDFGLLRFEESGPLAPAYFGLEKAKANTAFAFVFTGFLLAPQDGEYSFALDADDGARLLIDGQRVIDYDGLHNMGNPRVASVRLAAGRRPIRLEYFQRDREKGLAVSWSGPGFAKRMLSTPTGPRLSPQDFQQQLRMRGEKLFGARKLSAYEAATGEVQRLKKAPPEGPHALCATEAGRQAPDTFVLGRGSPQAPGRKVEPAFLSCLGGGVPAIAPPAAGQSTGRRLALANWIAAPDHRLAARVAVNRLWQHHFGRGLVRSANNFGQLGDPPTHPELLDWLAAEFARGGGRAKALHRLLMLSAAYRQDSRNPASAAADPGNDLFGRFNLRRLSAEELRDAMLSASGLLNPKAGGPSVFPAISAEVLAGQSVPGAGWHPSPPAEQNRRTIYVFVKRSLILPLSASFDFPETDGSCEARFLTTQPGQALALLNGAFARRQAAELAARVRREAGPGLEDQLALAWRLAVQREAAPAEIARGTAFVAGFRAKHGLSADAALAQECLLLLNLNEFVYLD